MACVFKRDAQQHAFAHNSEPKDKRAVCSCLMFAVDPCPILLYAKLASRLVHPGLNPEMDLLSRLPCSFCLSVCAMPAGPRISGPAP